MYFSTQKTRSNHLSFPSVLNNLKQLPLMEFTHTQKNSNNHPEKTQRAHQLQQFASTVFVMVQTV